MGMKANSGHFKGTNGEKSYRLTLNIQMFGSLPKNESQLKHIFRNKEGHLEDNSQSRALLISLSNDKNSYMGTDKNGLEWYSKMYGNKQLWVSVKNGIIQNGGINDKKIEFIAGEGIKKRILIRRKK